jgi:hypothetical protein
VSGERPTLAEVIAAHRRFGMQCTCGWPAADLFRTFAESHDHHVADAVREHILGLLADETLVERCADRMADVDVPFTNFGIARAMLHKVAEAVRES